MDKMIPYYVHEGETARMERTIRRLWVLCIIIFLAFVLSNGAWIYYEAQFETVVTEVEQDVDTGIGSAYVTGTGDINNGTDQTDGQD